MNISYDFSGKVVLITGSADGIGAKTALLFSSAGAQVVVTGSNAKRLSKVAKQCTDVSPNGLTALEVVAEVAKEDHCHQLIQTVVNTYGKLNILVMNADIVWNNSITDSEYIEKYKQIMETNLNSVVYLTHLSIDYLKQTKGNVVINASIEGLLEGSEYTPNCMSKSGINIFTRIVATELKAQGIRVNAINPGGIRTNVHIYNSLEKTVFDSVRNNYPFWRNPIQRVKQSDDISGAILFLASERAANPRLLYNE